MLRRACLSSLLLLASCANPPEQAASEPAPATRPAAPALSEARSWPGVDNVFQQGQDYFTGQPSEEALRYAAAQGVRTVINLRDDEQADVAFDEAALVKELGLTYRHVPLSSRSFTAADVATFGKLLEGSDGPVLIHCRSGNRVGGLWATHLVGQGRIEPGDLVRHGEAAGLSSPQTTDRAREVSAELVGER